MTKLEPLTQEHIPVLLDMAQHGQDIVPREGGNRACVTIDGRFVGLVDFWEDEITIEPHVEWHYSASKRDKYNGFIDGLREMGRFKAVVLKVTGEQTPLFDMMAKRKILRKVGTLNDIKEHGTVHIYQLNQEIKH